MFSIIVYSSSSFFLWFSKSLFEKGPCFPRIMFSPIFRNIVLTKEIDMFNFAYDSERGREFFYFRQTNHYFQKTPSSSYLHHAKRNWFPHDSKEIDFDKEASSAFWFAMSV